MHRIALVFGFLIALIGSASAGPWGGMDAAAARQAQPQIQKVACGHSDFFCPFGRYRACAPNGQCWCNRCGVRYWNDPNYRYEPPRPGPPALLFNFGGSGDDDRRYSPPSRQWRTWNNCPPNYTIQDGLCKPYRGY